MQQLMQPSQSNFRQSIHSASLPHAPIIRGDRCDYQLNKTTLKPYRRELRHAKLHQQCGSPSSSKAINPITSQ